MINLSLLPKNQLAFRSDNGVSFFKTRPPHPDRLDETGKLKTKARPRLQTRKKEILRHECLHLEVALANGDVLSWVSIDGNKHNKSPHVMRCTVPKTSHDKIAEALLSITSASGPIECRDMVGLSEPGKGKPYGEDRKDIKSTARALAVEISKLNGKKEYDKLAKLIKSDAGITARAALASLDPDACTRFEQEVGEKREFDRKELIDLAQKHGILAKTPPELSKAFIQQAGLKQEDADKINQQLNENITRRQTLFW